MAKADARSAFQYGLAIFTLTALLGLANATQLFGALDRNTLLTHLHSGTLGWITMGVIGLAIWLFGAEGKTMAIRVSALSTAAYVLAFWSGNFYARTGCDSTTGICENATCVGAAGGLACGPGTGPSPGVNTLAETTMQAYSSSDYYDVSIINGLNFATQFGPTNVAISSSDAYTCGVAGSASAQNGGYPANPTAGLPAAPWTLNPTASASFPPGVTVDGDPLSYYQLVVPSGRTELCTSSSSCGTGAWATG